MAALLSPSPKFNAFANAGVLGAGYKLYTYASGTTTPATVYQNRAGTVAHTNPIVLDVRGEAQIYLTPGTNYRYVLKTDQDVTVWTQDDIEANPLATDLATSSGSSLVGFLQAGIGAVLRTLQGKGRERVTVTDFMSDAERDDILLVNPVLDHTASIQKAFDAQSVSQVKDSARLHFPFGNYRISSELVARFNGVIYGDGVECTRLTLLNATQNGIRIPYSGTLQIHGLHFKAGTTKTAGAAIKVEGISPTSASNQTRIFNCKIDSQYTGIDMANAGFWTIRDSIISDCTIGIRSDNTQNFDSGDNLIEGCVIYRTGSDVTAGTRGILHVASGGLKIVGTKVLGFEYGYYLNPRSGATYVIDTQIIGCSFEYQTDCIRLETTNAGTSIAQFTLVGNQLFPRGAGVHLKGNIGGGTVSANQIGVTFASGFGIRFGTDGTNTPGNVNVSGNAITGNSSASTIGVQGGYAPRTNNNALSGNSISGVATEVIGWLGYIRDATYTFANLPTDATNGSMVYCSDGTIASPVAGGGTGCIAKRINGAWVGN